MGILVILSTIKKHFFKKCVYPQGRHSPHVCLVWSVVLTWTVFYIKISYQINTMKI